MTRIRLAVVVCVVAGFSPTFNDRPAGAGEEPGEFVWGINGHPFAQKSYRPDTDGVSYEEQIGLLAELGMTSYRCGLDLSRDLARDWLDRLVGIA